MSEKQYFAGIDIGGTNIKFGIFDETAKVIYRSHRPTESNKGATPLIHKLTNIAEQLLLHASEEELEIKQLGVGSPGAVDINSGQVISVCPNIKDWKGIAIGAHLKKHLNIPVYVDNDANAMALAEQKFGAAAGFNSAVCLTIGTGIGGALIMNGSVYRGSNFSAGELGHVSINPDGEKCNCGNRGCLELYCSSKAITKSAKKLLSKHMTEDFEEILKGEPENLTIKKIFLAFDKGDTVAREVIEEAAYYLAVGIAGVVNLINPQAVIIGGGVADGSLKFVELVEKDLRKIAFDSAVEKLIVKKAILGNDAGFIGAGLLGLHIS